MQQINEMGENYLEPEQLSTWKTARTEFDKQRDQLSSQVLGLDPQRIRPITYVTYFFRQSIYQRAYLGFVVINCWHRN